MESNGDIEEMFNNAIREASEARAKAIKSTDEASKAAIKSKVTVEEGKAANKKKKKKEAKKKLSGLFDKAIKERRKEKLEQIAIEDELKRNKKKNQNSLDWLSGTELRNELGLLGQDTLDNPKLEKLRQIKKTKPVVSKPVVNSLLQALKNKNDDTAVNESIKALLTRKWDTNNLSAFLNGSTNEALSKRIIQDKQAYILSRALEMGKVYNTNTLKDSLVELIDFNLRLSKPNISFLKKVESWLGDRSNPEFNKMGAILIEPFIKDDRFKTIVKKYGKVIDNYMTDYLLAKNNYFEESLNKLFELPKPSKVEEPDEEIEVEDVEQPQEQQEQPQQGQQEEPQQPPQEQQEEEQKQVANVPLNVDDLNFAPPAIQFQAVQEAVQTNSMLPVISSSNDNALVTLVDPKELLKLKKPEEYKNVEEFRKELVDIIKQANQKQIEENYKQQQYKPSAALRTPRPMFGSVYRIDDRHPRRTDGEQQEQPAKSLIPIGYRINPLVLLHSA